MAMGYQPSQGGTIKFGWISESWQLYSQNMVTWAVCALIYLVIIGGVFVGGELGFGITSAITASSIAASSSGSTPSPFSGVMGIFMMPMYWVLLLIVAVISSFLNAGFFRMANAAVRGEAIEIPMLFQGGPYMLQVLLTQLAIGVIGGILGCTIVGPLIVYGLLGPALALAADGEPVGEALSKSFNAMKSQWLMAAVFVLVMTLIVAVSEIPCFIGLLATIPMLMICLSLIYRDMIGMPGAQAGSVGAYAQAPGQWPPAPGAPAAPSNPYATPQAPAQSPYAPPVTPQSAYAPPAEPQSAFTPPPITPEAPPITPESSLGELPPDGEPPSETTP